MKPAAIVIGVLLAVPAFAKHAPNPAVDTAILRYPEAPTANVQTASGILYRLALAPRPSVDGSVSNLELILQHQADPADAPNLFDPPGNWPGYQPYIFAATDFKAGAAASLFGVLRSVCRTGGGFAATIEVTSVATDKVVLEHRFAAMALRVVLADIPVKNGQPVCR